MIRLETFTCQVRVRYLLSLHLPGRALIVPLISFLLRRHLLFLGEQAHHLRQRAGKILQASTSVLVFFRLFRNKRSNLFLINNSYRLPNRDTFALGTPRRSLLSVFAIVVHKPVPYFLYGIQTLLGDRKTVYHSPAASR